MSDPPLLSTSKTTDWDTRLAVLGWIIDTEALTVTFAVTQAPQAAFAPRRVAPVSCICFCEAGVQARGFSHAYLVRGASGIVFFVQRLLASVGVPHVASGAGYAYRMPEPGRRVALGPEFHGDLELLRWFAAEGLDARGGTLSAPMYRLLERPARRTLFSDASKAAVGSFCLETGVQRPGAVPVLRFEWVGWLRG